MLYTSNHMNVNRSFKLSDAAGAEFMRKHGLKRFGTCMFKKDGALSLTTWGSTGTTRPRSTAGAPGSDAAPKTKYDPMSHVA
jgi:hypothetical protein